MFRAEGVENSVLSAQFCYEPKTALIKSVFKKGKNQEAYTNQLMTSILVITRKCLYLPL